jgi:hypothetical protein
MRALPSAAIMVKNLASPGCSVVVVTDRSLIVGFRRRLISLICRLILLPPKMMFFVPKFLATFFSLKKSVPQMTSSGRLSG